MSVIYRIFPPQYNFFLRVMSYLGWPPAQRRSRRTVKASSEQLCIEYRQHLHLSVWSYKDNQDVHMWVQAYWPTQICVLAGQFCNAMTSRNLSVYIFTFAAKLPYTVGLYWGHYQPVHQLQDPTNSCPPPIKRRNLF